MDYEIKIKGLFAEMNTTERSKAMREIAATKGVTLTTLYKYIKGSGKRIDISRKILSFFEEKEI